MTTKKHSPHQHEPTFSPQAVSDLATTLGAADSDAIITNKLAGGDTVRVHTLGNIADGEGWFSLNVPENEQS